MSVGRMTDAEFPLSPSPPRGRGSGRGVSSGSRGNFLRLRTQPETVDAHHGPLRTRLVRRPAGDELFLSAPLGAARSPAQAWAEVSRLLEHHHATAICVDVFGRPAREYDAFAALAREVPCLWVTGKTDDSPLGGMLVWATTAPGVESTGAHGRVVGRAFHDGEVKWCRMGGLHPLEPEGSPADQAQQTFAAIESELLRVGMRFSHVLRTWFYNDDILAWYGDFNRVRTAFFKEHGVFEGLVPASTGIGGQNPAGTALNVGLLALRSDSAEVKVTALPSPLQCAALQYGSSFSRAVEVRTPTHQRVLISGTASIEPGGKSVHQDDVGQQIDLTMKVVLAILESRGLAWSDVVRGVAYLRHCADAPKWTSYLASHQLQDLPVVVTENVVCRDDLLFEIEVDAIR